MRGLTRLRRWLLLPLLLALLVGAPLAALDLRGGASGSGTVTSIIAGTGISVNAATGDVTVTSSGTQTPWAQDIDGMGFDLTNVGSVAVVGTGAGTVTLENATSGSIALQAVTGALGTRTILVPAASGTLGVSATAPITLSAAGAIGCATCATSSGAAPTYTVLSTDAALAMAANTVYLYDMSGFTAARTATLPANCTVGDLIGVVITAGNTTATRELLLMANTSDFLNGVAGGTEWSRLFITNEKVLMRCVVTNTTWIVEVDGRIPQQGLMYLSTSASAESATTFTAPTSKSGVWTALTDIGNITSVSNDRMIVRRAGNYSALASGHSTNAIVSGGWFGVGLTKNDASTTVATYQFNEASASSALALIAKASIQSIPLVATDFLAYNYRTLAGSIGLNALALPRLDTSFAVREILP